MDFLYHSFSFSTSETTFFISYISPFISYRSPWQEKVSFSCWRNCGYWISTVRVGSRITNMACTLTKTNLSSSQLLPVKKIRKHSEVMKKSFRCNRNTNLLDLPSDIITDILLKLPLETLSRTRSVSKTLLNKVDDPLIIPTDTRISRLLVLDSIVNSIYM